MIYEKNNIGKIISDIYVWYVKSFPIAPPLEIPHDLPDIIFDGSL